MNKYIFNAQLIIEANNERDARMEIIMNNITNNNCFIIGGEAKIVCDEAALLSVLTRHYKATRGCAFLPEMTIEHILKGYAKAIADSDCFSISGEGKE